MYQNVAYTYREANVLTANPLKLVIMCYDGAINSLKIAREAYLKKDYETKAKALQKTLDIIHELDASLDMEKGGDISKNLRGLYLFMNQALIEADLKRDLKVFDRIIGLLEELLSAWAAIGANGEAKAPTAGRGERPAGIPLSVVKTTPVARTWSA
ncbi:MAG TPA: flagellar export chaperone FliS [Syntrophales bacterium]|jgi:flagellar protein FliS|nr:flagellar export chaperone FliS [Syntrophales bacterium]HPC33092.1 flagellar export chaperone FliS [Syntrophales bacterium]HRR46105.1 flagellar export chaperone FliS [Syntrophales bacterium]HRU88362.1 flagellar export chaperone FliS [Syntrophales bacterium]